MAKGQNMRCKVHGIDHDAGEKCYACEEHSLGIKSLSKILDAYNEQIASSEYVTLGNYSFTASAGNSSDVWGTVTIQRNDPDSILERSPEEYERMKQKMIESSRFYEKPKEEKPYEYDPDFDDL